MRNAYILALLHSYWQCRHVTQQGRKIGHVIVSFFARISQDLPLLLLYATYQLLTLIIYHLYIRVTNHWLFVMVFYFIRYTLNVRFYRDKSNVFNFIRICLDLESSCLFKSLAIILIVSNFLEFNAHRTKRPLRQIYLYRRRIINSQFYDSRFA